MGKFTLQTSPERSRIMAAIRGKGNASTEQRMVSILRQHQISGWRRHQPIFGSPDFTFEREHVAIFVDGCFWHGCPLCYRAPRNNREFWRAKIARNAARDRRTSRRLRAIGWSVLRFWEHTLKDGDAVAARVKRTLSQRSCAVR
ncbi:MAG: DNA mismatch endonuclease Vsr [Proteobacteria bacterium]|nr:DNA mismatch endonuclease Vsr [Pseudomonadota bacterium]